MAGKLSELTALTGAGAATGDQIEVRDVSDTTMAATGTNKSVTLAELVNFLKANGLLDPATAALVYTPITTSVFTTAPLAGGGNLSADRTLTIAVASETVVGAVELATAVETVTGTSQALAVHPQGAIQLANSGPLFGFAFDTTTTAGTSTNGLRINNATPASATIAYINYTARSGVDLKTRLLAGTAGDRLYIQDRTASGTYRLYELTGAPTDNTTYATINVVHRTGAGSLWANGASLVAGFISPPITVGTSAPASPLTNDLWIDTT